MSCHIVTLTGKEGGLHTSVILCKPHVVTGIACPPFLPTLHHRPDFWHALER